MSTSGRIILDTKEKLRSYGMSRATAWAVLNRGGVVDMGPAEAEWRQVDLLPDCYEVSKCGLVRVSYSGDNRKLGVLTSKPNKPGGYTQLGITIDGKIKAFYLHRLVAIAWVPNPLGKPFINHIDGNPRNNAATNLEWCTQSENVQHAYDTGLIKK